MNLYQDFQNWINIRGFIPSTIIMHVPQARGCDQLLCLFPEDRSVRDKLLKQNETFVSFNIQSVCILYRKDEPWTATNP